MLLGLLTTENTNLGPEIDTMVTGTNVNGWSKVRCLLFRSYQYCIPAVVRLLMTIGWQEDTWSCSCKYSHLVVLSMWCSHRWWVGCIQCPRGATSLPQRSSSVRWSRQTFHSVCGGRPWSGHDIWLGLALSNWPDFASLVWTFHLLKWYLIR